jgi:MULE transposase domain
MALIQRDYYNERARIAREELGGKSPIQALLEILTADNSPKAEWSTNFRTEFGDGGGPLTHLYIVHNKYRKLLAENPEALIIDSTYRTNRYSMPPVNIVGMTSVNRSFYAGSRFMSGETYPDFLYLFENIKREYDEMGLPYPKTFVSDGDTQQMNAMEQVFPGVNHIHCIWHLNGNIQTRIKPLIRQQYETEAKDGEQISTFLDKKWKTFKKDWLKAVAAKTEE